MTDLLNAPEVWKDCEICGGEGVIYRNIFVYEAGCGFGHDDVYSVECDACAGNGGFICEDEGDRLTPLHDVLRSDGNTASKT
ncbi:hypothetical protein [Bradyrhizobium sp. Arg816]|uniref:hypothetical protein n=1 Tax=Bradyrhizobium sp. Arg816 TaxID=2998491 RepID=UPI00249E1D87|nr:hypothetical protein [Bradyrhizobium sp. Arg816]MDI3563517.1 hypothetical protein [Bradyrhizobium sp. Arg816]